MSSKLPYTPASAVVVLKEVTDFKKTPAASAAVVPVLSIPAGTLVERVGYTVITPEGGTAAGTVGDGADVDGFFTAVNLNQPAGFKAISTLALTEAAPNTVTGYTGGKFYTVADTIDYIPNAALDAAVVEWWAICIQP